MKRDIELERKILLEIEKIYKPGNIWINVDVDNYDTLIVAEHCKFLHQQGLIAGFNNTNGMRNYKIQNLTAKGYETLELIRNEKAWKKAQKTAEEKEVPQTMENIAEIAGIIIGKVIKEISGVP